MNEMERDEILKYELKLLREIEETKIFSWKRIKKTIELLGVSDALRG